MEFMLNNLKFSVLCFVDHCLSVCPFSFGSCIVCPSIYMYIPLLIPITLVISSNCHGSSRKLVQSEISEPKICCRSFKYRRGNWIWITQSKVGNLLVLRRDPSKNITNSVIRILIYTGGIKFI